MRYVTTRSIFFSIVLHVSAGGLLFISLDFAQHPIRPDKPRVNTIDVITVDNKQVEAELSRLKEIDKQKEDEQKRRQQELETKLKDLERKTSDTEKRRKEEEKRLTNLKKNQEEEKKKREEEELKLTDAKKQREELKRKEEEQKRIVAEEALKQQLAEEQRRREEVQARQDQNIINRYHRLIASAIEREFNITGLQAGLSCEFRIRMIPGGEVVEARIIKSSGDTVFDRRAEVALKKASPLPVADDPRIFNKMREIRFTFVPK